MTLVIASIPEKSANRFSPHLLQRVIKYAALRGDVNTCILFGNPLANLSEKAAVFLNTITKNAGITLLMPDLETIQAPIVLESLTIIPGNIPAPPDAKQRLFLKLNNPSTPHPGDIRLTTDNTLTPDAVDTIRVPDLNRSPFQFLLLQPNTATASTRSLRLDTPIPDCHTHTRLAYCNDDMDPDIERALMDMLNIPTIVKTEHSGHLFFTISEYWSKNSLWYHNLPMSPENCRVKQYLDLLKDQYDDPRFIPGTEIDITSNGKLIINDELINATSFNIGAVHVLDNPNSPEAVDVFLAHCKTLLSSGLVKALAHPYRVFTWDGIGIKPESSFDTLVKMLRDYNVAAEINFHHNLPSPLFTQKCLDAGVKITFGSDAHALYEPGFFLPNVEFLRNIGYDGDLQDILLNPLNP